MIHPFLIRVNNLRAHALALGCTVDVSFFGPVHHVRVSIDGEEANLSPA